MPSMTLSLDPEISPEFQNPNSKRSETKPLIITRLAKERLMMVHQALASAGLPENRTQSSLEQTACEQEATC